MAYQSPFRYLPSDVTFPIDPVVVQRARKKMLAEFELAGPGVQGLSKHDALRWLDTLSAVELYHHKLIYDRPVILEFLENGNVSGERWYHTLPADEAATTFILSQVQQQFNALFASAFQANDIERLEQLKAFELPELEKKGRYYYSGAAHAFGAQYHQLTALVQNVSADTVNELSAFVSQPFIRTMAILPAYFDSMRNEFASMLLQAVPNLTDDKVRATSVAYSVAAAARSVAASAELKATAKRTANQHVEGRTLSGASTHGTTDASPPKKKNYGCIIAAVIVFVVLRLLLTLLG